MIEKTKLEKKNNKGIVLYIYINTKLISHSFFFFLINLFILKIEKKQYGCNQKNHFFLIAILPNDDDDFSISNQIKQTQTQQPIKSRNK